MVMLDANLSCLDTLCEVFSFTNLSALVDFVDRFEEESFWGCWILNMKNPEKLRALQGLDLANMKEIVLTADSLEKRWFV